MDIVDKIAAMEKRSRELNTPPLTYINPDVRGLSTAEAERAVSLGLAAERIVTDVHVNAGGGVGAALGRFSHPPLPGFNQGVRDITYVGCFRHNGDITSISILYLVGQHAGACLPQSTTVHPNLPAWLMTDYRMLVE